MPNPEDNQAILDQMRQYMPQQRDIMTMPMGSATTGKGHFKDFLLNAIGMAPSLIGRAPIRTPMNAGAPPPAKLPSSADIDAFNAMTFDKYKSSIKSPSDMNVGGSGVEPGNNMSSYMDLFTDWPANQNKQAPPSASRLPDSTKYLLELLKQKQQRFTPTAEELVRNTGVKDANQPLYDFKMQSLSNTLLKTMDSATNDNLIKTGAYLPKDLKDALLDIKSKTLPPEGHPLRAEFGRLLDRIVKSQGHHPDKLSDYLNLPLQEKIDLILHGPKNPK